MLGVAIKDAQELGMHRDGVDTAPVHTKLDDQWHLERRRRLYMILSIWYFTLMNRIIASRAPTDYDLGIFTCA